MGRAYWTWQAEKLSRIAKKKKKMGKPGGPKRGSKEWAKEKERVRREKDLHNVEELNSRKVCLKLQ